MRRTKNTPPVPTDAMAAARAAAAELDRERAMREAQRQVAELRAEQADRRATRAHHTGRGCARCGATHPPAGWSTAVGIDNMPSPCCTLCADPQAGSGNDGWVRPVLLESEVRGVLLSRLLGLGTDVRWLYSWGSGRRGLEFPFAAELDDVPAGERAAWSHVDLTPWRPVGVEAARRHRAFGGPKILGATIDGLSVDAAQTDLAGFADEFNRADVFDRQHLARRRPNLPTWSQEQIEAAEQAALERRLSELDAEELATAARIAEQADREDRNRARALINRRIRREVADYERQLRRQATIV